MHITKSRPFGTRPNFMLQEPATFIILPISLEKDMTYNCNGQISFAHKAKGKEEL